MRHSPKYFDEIASLFSASCPFGKLSVRQNVRSAKRPFGKTSVGKMSFGKMSFGKVSFGKMSGYPGKYPTEVLLDIFPYCSNG
jgi:hypothetical protein